MRVYEEEEEKLKCIKVAREIILNNFIWEACSLQPANANPIGTVPENGGNIMRGSF